MREEWICTDIGVTAMLEEAQVKWPRVADWHG